MAQTKPAFVVSPAGDLLIPQGADFDRGFVWRRDNVAVPLVTDGWVVRAQLRRSAGADVWLDLTSVDADLTDGSCIGINDDGEIIVHIAWEDTEGGAWNTPDRREGRWDMEAHNPATNEKRRLVMGKVTISPDITREA